MGWVTATTAPSGAAELLDMGLVAHAQVMDLGDG